jgi:HlyD family secretion protein
MSGEAAGLRRGAPAGEDAPGLRPTGEPGSEAARPAYRPGTIYLLEGGKATPVRVMTGLTDGAFTEVRADEVEPGDTVIVGLEVAANNALQPPPGMGGPQFRGPGGRGRR